MPARSRNDSSIKYGSMRGAASRRMVTIRALMSPYKVELAERTANCLRTSRGTSWMGWPMPTPSALASALRAMAQPSLLESTTTGLPRSAGSNTRSQEA